MIAATIAGIGALLIAFFVSSPLVLGGHSGGSPVRVSLICTLSKPPRSGAIIILTYHMSLQTAGVVGLSAGIYSKSGNDYSTGYGDISGIQLLKGLVTESRPLLIPPNLPAGTYEIDAEIWPANEVGENGVNTIADTTCAFFSVPQRRRAG
jgi:hypothetical protein